MSKTSRVGTMSLMILSTAIFSSNYSFAAKPYSTRSCSNSLLESNISDSDFYKPITYKDGLIVEFTGTVNSITVRIGDTSGQYYTFARTNRSFASYELPSHLKKSILEGSFSGKKILDVGTGGGRAVEDMRRAGVEAHGLDIILDSVQKSKSYFHQQNMKDTKFEDEVFDMVISNFSFFSYKKVKIGQVDYFEGIAVLKELTRILKTGGSLILGATSKSDLVSILKVFPNLKIVGFHTPKENSGSDDSTWVMIGKINNN